jgi:hypothetical protein
VPWFDPSKIADGFVADFAPREEHVLAVAIKFDDGTCWAWTSESYQHGWRHPEWKLPAEPLRLRARILASGTEYADEFLLDTGAPLETFAVTRVVATAPGAAPAAAQAVTPLPSVRRLRVVK